MPRFSDGLETIGGPGFGIVGTILVPDQPAWRIARGTGRIGLCYHTHIGAPAKFAGLTPATRDLARYRTYSPPSDTDLPELRGHLLWAQGYPSVRRCPVQAHAGEALAEREAFSALSGHERDCVIEFLKSLQVLPVGTAAAIVDEIGAARL